MTSRMTGAGDAELVAKRALHRALAGLEQAADNGTPHTVERDLPKGDGLAFRCGGPQDFRRFWSCLPVAAKKLLHKVLTLVSVWYTNIQQDKWTGEAVAATIRKTPAPCGDDADRGAARQPMPLKLIAAMAVVKNPWAGRGFVEDLEPEIHAVGPVLGELLTRMIIETVGSGEAVEAYGKAAVVGLDGEIEHASALIHTLRFGNHYRTAVGAKSYLAFCNTRGPANAPIMIPLMDKNDEGRRSHYLTIQMRHSGCPGSR